MVQHNLGEISVVLGQKNSGKSVLIEHLLTQMERYVVLDPLGDHAPPGSVNVNSPTELLEAWMAGYTQIVVRDTPLRQEKAEDYLKVAGQLKNFHLIIDECDKYMSAHEIPEVLHNWAHWHISHGNCGMILASRQATNINTSIWTQVDNYFIFNYGNYEDAKIKELPLAEEYKRKIHEIDPSSYKFLYFRNMTGHQPEVGGPVPLPRHMR